MKDSKDQSFGLNINQKVKFTRNDYRYFLESNLVGISKLSFFIQTQKTILKGTKPKGIICQKEKHYKAIINGKNHYGQPIASVKKRFEETRKLTQVKVKIIQQNIC